MYLFTSKHFHILTNRYSRSGRAWWKSSDLHALQSYNRYKERCSVSKLSTANRLTALKWRFGQTKHDFSNSSKNLEFFFSILNTFLVFLRQKNMLEMPATTLAIQKHSLILKMRIVRFREQITQTQGFVPSFCITIPLNCQGSCRSVTGCVGNVFYIFRTVHSRATATLWITYSILKHWHAHESIFRMTFCFLIGYLVVSVMPWIWANTKSIYPITYSKPLYSVVQTMIVLEFLLFIF